MTTTQKFIGENSGGIEIVDGTEMMTEAAAAPSGR
jgi:hypothetical protein